jgi:uncharacterized membrane protein
MLLALLEAKDDVVYRALFLLHILAVIVGFGGVFFNGRYGVEARQRAGREGLAIREANLAVSAVAERFIYAVPVLGFLLIWRSDGAFSFADSWITLSIAFYIAGVAIGQVVLARTRRQMIEVMHNVVESDSAEVAALGSAEMKRLGQRMSTFGRINRVLLFANLYLMIWKPGL